MEHQLKVSRLSDNIAIAEPSILPHAYVGNKVKVVKIHDGNTCHVHMIYNEQICRFVCRLKGITAPELGEPNSLIARDYLTHLCMGGGELSFEKTEPRHEEAELQDMLNNNRFFVCSKFYGHDDKNRALVALMRARNLPKSYNQMLVGKGLAEEHE